MTASPVALTPGGPPASSGTSPAKSSLNPEQQSVLDITKELFTRASPTAPSCALEYHEIVPVVREVRKEVDTLALTLQLWEFTDFLEKGAESSTPESVTAVTPEPPIALTKQNQSPSPATPPVSALKKEQIEIISALGSALYQDVFPSILPWLCKQFVELLKEPAIAAQISKLMFGESAKPKTEPITPTADPPAPLSEAAQKLLRLGIANQLKSTLGSLSATLKETTKDAELRKGFGELIPSFLKTTWQDLSADQHKTARYALELYGPETLLAMTESLETVFADPQNSALIDTFRDVLQNYNPAEPYAQLPLLLKKVLELGLPAPLDASLTVFVKRLLDVQISAPFFQMLREDLLAFFFPAPKGLTPVHLKLIPLLINGVTQFFAALNQALEKASTMNSSEDDKRDNVMQNMKQGVLTKGIFKIVDPTTPEKVMQSGIKELLQSIFAQSSLHPIGKILLGAFFSKIANVICNPTTLYVLVDNFLTHPMSLYNPFDPQKKAQGPLDLVNKPFSASLEKEIDALKHELVIFGCIRGLQTALEIVLNFFIPSGDAIQDKLNRLLKSGTRMLPVLTTAQICYALPSDLLPPDSKDQVALNRFLRGRFQLGLKTRKPALDFPKLFKMQEADFEVLKKRVQDNIRGDDTQTAKIRALLGQVLPTLVPGVMKISLGLLQKLFYLAEHPLFIPLFATYLLDGVKSGLSLETKKNN